VRAVRNTEDGIRVVDAPDPEGAGVRVHVRAASICGSDLHMLGYGPSPVTLGHEFAGVLDDGTPVAVDPSGPCGECDQCARGLGHLCRTGAQRVLGVGLDGGMAEHCVVAPRAVVPLAATVRPEDACLVEPLGISVHGFAVAGIEPGQRVAVVGAGSIGLGAVAVARANGCDVALVARHDAQRAAGERLGAGGPSGEYDVVVEAAGTESALAQAAELCRPRGTVLFLSTHWTPVTMPSFPAAMKELAFRWSFMSGNHAGVHDLDVAAALLAHDPEIAATLVTHRFPLEDAAEAFRVAADRASGAIKVAIEPG
jgi:threonine dehydrogenase-like Zn-dependent dehydrogenase